MVESRQPVAYFTECLKACILTLNVCTQKQISLNVFTNLVSGKLEELFLDLDTNSGCLMNLYHVKLNIKTLVSILDELAKLNTKNLVSRSKLPRYPLKSRLSAKGNLAQKIGKFWPKRFHRKPIKGLILVIFHILCLYIYFMWK